MQIIGHTEKVGKGGYIIAYLQAAPQRLKTAWAKTIAFQFMACFCCLFAWMEEVLLQHMLPF